MQNGAARTLSVEMPRDSCTISGWLSEPINLPEKVHLVAAKQLQIGGHRRPLAVPRGHCRQWRSCHHPRSDLSQSLLAETAELFDLFAWNPSRQERHRYLPAVETVPACTFPAADRQADEPKHKQDDGDDPKHMDREPDPGKEQDNEKCQ